MVVERLSKFLSGAGVASRRKADELIHSGDVKVNNIVVLNPWYKVDSHEDTVTVHNNIVYRGSTRIYIALYKPKGYLSDLSPREDVRLARDLVPVKGRLFPVGRLDFNSEGLLLLSNDGDFANRVMHPRFGNTREYLVKFQGIVTKASLDKVRKGVKDGNDILSVVSIDALGETASNSWCRIVLAQGKYREIRRIGTGIGHNVLKLRRVRIGHILLGSLKPGQYRHLEPWEINSILLSGFDDRAQ
jgi:23S rRNA pseudouridine2605 synthase